MKDYKPTLKLVKNKWYVSMTVPFELRNILTNQVRLSTGTSDKNEALKRSPEIAIERVYYTHLEPTKLLSI